MNRKVLLLISFLAASAVFVGVAIAASSPSVTTGAPSSIKNSTAVLNGTVNPNGASTTYSFELGLAKDAYFETGPHPPKSVGSGTAAKAVSVKAGGLLPGTTYHYRLTAINRFGQTIGADRTLKTTHRHSVRLHVRIHFRGNGFLAPANARNESVILGSG